MTDENSPQCEGTAARTGARCKRRPAPGERYCWRHLDAGPEPGATVAELSQPPPAATTPASSALPSEAQTPSEPDQPLVVLSVPGPISPDEAAAVKAAVSVAARESGTRWLCPGELLSDRGVLHCRRDAHGGSSHEAVLPSPPPKDFRAVNPPAGTTRVQLWLDDPTFTGPRLIQWRYR